jgi:hypothetical protein
MILVGYKYFIQIIDNKNNFFMQNKKNLFLYKLHMKVIPDDVFVDFIYKDENYVLVKDPKHNNDIFHYTIWSLNENMNDINDLVNVTDLGQLYVKVNHNIYGDWFFFIMLLILWIILFIVMAEVKLYLRFC